MTLLENVSTTDFGRWAIAGLGAEGVFLLERWSLRQDFPLVALGQIGSDPQHLAKKNRLPVCSNFAELLRHPQVDGLILTTPLSERGPQIHAALSAGKHLLIEGALCDSAVEATRLCEFAKHQNLSMGVFHVRRADPDFHAARSAVVRQRLGALQSVRWIDCEYSLPPEPHHARPFPTWQEVLAWIGPLLFDQLAQLIGATALTVQAWTFPETAGFQIRLTYANSLTVWIDVQRASQTGLRTGWVLEGTRGAYRAGRLITLAGDGELCEEDVPMSASAIVDVMSDLRRLAFDRCAAQESLQNSVQTAWLIAAMRNSVESGQLVSIRDLRESTASV